MKTYIVALPGHAPRVIMTISDEQLVCNVLDGEVAFTQVDYPPAPHRINDAGDEFVAIDLTMVELKAERWAQAKRLRNFHSNAGCMTALGRVDTDPDSRAKIGGAVQMAMLSLSAGAPFSINWAMTNNAVVAHDAPAMVALGLATAQHVASCHDRVTATRDEIEAAADAVSLEAIDLAVGWPG